MLRTPFTALLVIPALAGCGGGTSGSNTAPLPAAEVTAGDTFGVVEVDPDTRRVIVPVGSRAINLGVTRDGTTAGTFHRFTGGDGMLFEAEGESGIVRVFSRVDGVASSIGPGTTAERFDGASLPTGGTATLSGSYVGFFTRDESTTVPNLTEAYISGTAILTADFDKGEVSGRITDRNRFSTASDTLFSAHEDVHLGAAKIVDGKVDGTTSGGAIAGNPRYMPEGGETRGAYSALIGDGGNEIGGVLRIEHDYENGAGQTQDDYIEVGGFAVSR